MWRFRRKLSSLFSNWIDTYYNKEPNSKEVYLMKELSNSTRDIARELARKYSTMTHDELDILESVLVPMKFAKGEMILK